MKARPKTSWRPAPPELVRLFEDAVRDFPRVQTRKMFGYPAAFVNGNMVGGLFQESMILRLSPGDLATIRDEEGTSPFEPRPGRVMRGYVVIPEGTLKSRARVKAWIGRALGYTSSLPPKPPRSGSKKAHRARPSRRR